jgi:hypothetical protein
MWAMPYGLPEPHEFRAGGASSTNLTITELDNPGRSYTVLSSGNPLPAPILLGTGGLIPPGTVIEDDATGNVETSGVFDPAADGIDFYESLEGMLVQVNDAVATGPGVISAAIARSRSSAIRGECYGTSARRVAIQAGDFNPEIIILNDLIAAGHAAPVNVVTCSPETAGVMDYSFGNYLLEVISLPRSPGTWRRSRLRRQRSSHQARSMSRTRRRQTRSRSMIRWRS